MADDIAPKLLKRVQDEFNRLCGADKTLKKLKEDAKTYHELNDYAERLGNNLKRAFATIYGDDLPNGKMYYNIAEKVVRPMLVGNWNDIATVGEVVQNAINESAGVGIKAIKPGLAEDRIGGIVDRLSEADEFEKAKWLLDEPVVNFSRHAVDEMVRVNAEFQNEAGLETVFVRTDPGCCAWCAKLRGTYTYSTMPENFWARHENCNCTIDYKPYKKIGYQMRTSGKAFVKRGDIDRQNRNGG